MNSKDVFPYRLEAFTDANKLKDFLQREKASVIVAEENVYNQIREYITEEKVYVLYGEKLPENTDADCIFKYQSMETLYREIGEYYISQTQTQNTLYANCSARLIGFYSPVRRCMQTITGLTLGQMLAKEHKVLYLNFESCSGFSELMEREFRRDLTDLLYYLETAPEKFALRLRTMTEKVGELDFIPPVQSGQNLFEIQPAQWKALLSAIAGAGEYEYILLDLSDSLQGLFDILRLCTLVYTFVREDAYAEAKVRHYEHLLQLYEYEDVLGNTRKRLVPQIRRLPQNIEQYTMGDMADYVRALVRGEEIFGQISKAEDRA